MAGDDHCLIGMGNHSGAPRPHAIVARSHELFNARDFDAYSEVVDEDVELVMAGVAIRGLAAVTDYLRAAASARRGLRIETERIFVETDDTLVTEVRMVDTSNSHQAAHPLEFSTCSLYRMEGGRIVRWRVYLDSPAQAESSAAFSGVAAEQLALRRVAELIARHAPAEDVFALVTEELSALLGSDLMVRTVRFDPNGTATILAAQGGPETLLPPGANTPRPGGGILDQVFRTGRPGRVDDYGRVTGPLSVTLREAGIRSAAAGPIVVDGRTWGAMAVASGERLPPACEQRVAQFAELVSTAISNIESRAEVERLAAEQSALRRVATLVAREYSPEELFATLAEELAVLLGVDAAAILRYDGDGFATAVAGWGEKQLSIPVGARLPLTGENLAGKVLRSGLPRRMDDYSRAPGTIASTVRGLGFVSSVASPIIVEGAPWGVIGVLTCNPEPLPAGTEDRMAEFSRVAGMAVSNAKSRADLAQSRARIVRAGDEARRRFERDLHDGAQQRLVSLGFELQTLQASAPPALGRALADLRSGLGDVLDDLRELSRGLHPAVLYEGGLTPALRALARRSTVPVTVRIELDGERFEEPVEVAAYYVASETLTNTAKHAHASKAALTVRRREDRLELLVTDDGAGGAKPSGGSGLTGLIDRVEALGGSIQIDSPPEAGTTVHVDLPTRPR